MLCRARDGRIFNTSIIALFYRASQPLTNGAFYSSRRPQWLLRTQPRQVALIGCRSSHYSTLSTNSDQTVSREEALESSSKPESISPGVPPISHYNPHESADFYDGFHSEGSKSKLSKQLPPALDRFARSLIHDSSMPNSIKMTDGELGQTLIWRGYLGQRSDISKKLSFCKFYEPSLETSIQLIAIAKEDALPENCPLQQLRAIDANSPVRVEGIVQRKHSTSKTTSSSQDSNQDSFELNVTFIAPYNSFPKEIDMSRGRTFAPDQRHLQIRTDRNIREGLQLRHLFLNHCRKVLTRAGFREIDTPLLFKSTSEGAREFLVPTRRKGLAYALPQSPQQYKQILMASGINKYFQVAKCFRDEDPRADRQPEFSQLDMEVSFKDPMYVRHRVSSLLETAHEQLLSTHDGENSISIDRMVYQTAMSCYGSDKPDLRFDCKILSLEENIKIPNLSRHLSKITSAENPSVDFMKLSLPETDPRSARQFFSNFLTSTAGEPFRSNPFGAPTIVAIDEGKPFRGFEAVSDKLASLLSEKIGGSAKNGDFYVFQARKPNESGRWTGASTVMGNLRLALQAAAEEAELVPKRSGMRYVWVTNFPLFKKKEKGDVDIETGSGLVSNHHPFTSPASPLDVELLMTGPLAAEADHYDLVLNGVEIGGGSRRIHTADMQEYILKDVLKLPPAKLQEFSHLLEVLRCGCPPHSGFALGIDRLIAIWMDRSSIRDVIAFPKFGQNEDMLTKSPAKISDKELETYHMRLVG